MPSLLCTRGSVAHPTGSAAVEHRMPFQNVQSQLHRPLVPQSGCAATPCTSGDHGRVAPSRATSLCLAVALKLPTTGLTGGAAPAPAAAAGRNMPPSIAASRRMNCSTERPELAKAALSLDFLGSHDEDSPGLPPTGVKALC